MSEQDQEAECAESAMAKLILERQMLVKGSPLIPDKTPATEMFVPTMFFKVIPLITGRAEGSKWSSGWLDQSPLNSIATWTSFIWTSDIIASLI